MSKPDLLCSDGATELSSLRSFTTIPGTRLPWSPPTDYADKVASSFGLMQEGGSTVALQAAFVEWSSLATPTREQCRTLL